MKESSGKKVMAAPAQRVIILAAGSGTRLRPYTDDRPKCLLELGGARFLDWQDTNMITGLMCAASELKDNVIVSCTGIWRKKE